MILPIAFIVAGGIGSLLLWLVGIIVCVALVYALMRALGSPTWMYTALYVLAIIITLILAISFFFGNDSPGTVIVR